jgi:hypothetical protein
MAQGRGLAVADKTLYWWSVHLERFLNFCREAGAEASEIPEVAARLFLESLPVGSSAQEFAREQARMALDVFLSEVEGWAWGEDRFGRRGPKFRLKATRAGLTTEVTTENAGELLRKSNRRLAYRASGAGASESESTEGMASTNREAISDEGKAVGRDRASWEVMQHPLLVRTSSKHLDSSSGLSRKL